MSLINVLYLKCLTLYLHFHRIIVILNPLHYLTPVGARIMGTEF